MRLASVAVAISALLVLVAGAARAASGAEQVALKGIDRAVAAGRLPRSDAAADRAIVRRTARVWKKLPGGRGAALHDVLVDVAAQAGRYNRPRALTLFGMLKENTTYLATHALSGRLHEDITDADGVVYRYFPGHGFQFHPLGNFVALDAAENAQDPVATERLATALAARGVSNGAGGLVWEYAFPFGGGRAPWTSGMAQSVAAQAFARASTLLGEPSYANTAAAAYRAIPGRLARWTSFGTWIQLYAFNTTMVLNAQLQAALSLADYARITGDTSAGAFANRLRSAAVAALPSFDTGYWSLYSLSGEYAPLEYETYVQDELARLARTDPRFADAAARFATYTTLPPAFQLGDSGGAGVLFWVSKPSRVTVSGGGLSRSVGVLGGWHRVAWPTGSKPHAVALRLSAVDWAGHRATADALPVVRAALARPRALAAAPGLSSFAVGTGVDTAASAQRAVALGFRTVRMVVPWQAGQTAPAPETVAGLTVPAGTRLVVQLAYDTPDATLPAFAAALVAQVPAIADLIVGAPGQQAASYAPTLAAVADAVHAARPAVRVAGAASTPAALSQLGAAYRTSGRTLPLMDELAYRASVQPDYGKLVATLRSAFAGTAQPGAALPILWDGIGTVTKVPPAKAPLYGAEAAAPGAAERDQASAYVAALKLAACEPTAAGVLLDRLQDSATPGARDGLLYPDGAVKTSLAPLKPSLVQAQRGTLAVCPGLASPAVPTVLGFPQAGSLPAGTSSWSAQLGCSRDCLYLLTLERPNGVPMLARRGALAGGAPPATVTLPRLPVPAGTYRLRVRLVARVNPGTIVSQRSDPIQVVPRS